MKLGEAPETWVSFQSGARKKRFSSWEESPPALPKKGGSYLLETCTGAQKDWTSWILCAYVAVFSVNLVRACIFFLMAKPLGKAFLMEPYSSLLLSHNWKELWASLKHGELGPSSEIKCVPCSNEKSPRWGGWRAWLKKISSLLRGRSPWGAQIQRKGRVIEAWWTLLMWITKLAQKEISNVMEIFAKVSLG